MDFVNLADVVTPKQLANYLQISEMTVKRALKSGRLVGFKVGRDWRIEKTAVIKWLEGMDGAAADEAEVNDTAEAEGAEAL